MTPRGGDDVQTKEETERNAWWCGAVSSETEVLSAAVLCAATTKSSTSDPNTEKLTSQREIEAFIRTSPLPHGLLLPVLQCTPKFVIVESTSSVICAIRATSTTDVLEAVVGSTIPLSQPYVYRYAGARIHLPFWKRAQRLDLQSVYQHARARKKTLVLCGHSIAGSIAQIGLCELVYQHLPHEVRTQMEKVDTAARKRDMAHEKKESALALPDELREWQQSEEIQERIPHVMAMGFGSPYISSHELQQFLQSFGLTKRMVTFVNEFDCIPGILNVAQSAAMLTKTTERFLTITKATKTLLKLLPAQMQQVLVGLDAAKAGVGGIGNVTSAYVTMSLNILQNTFHRFREMNVVKELDYRYAPCGTYLFLKKNSQEYTIVSDTISIMRTLQQEDSETTSLTGNSILQHLMSAYVESIARRSKSIYINETMNYYERLNIPRNATQRQIRKAYRTLALKWHPDRWSSAVNPREKEMAEQVFKLLAESYEVLSDPDARRSYDAHLSKGLSFTEEFVRNGTVKGMTLDEAIATFRDVIDGATGAVSHVTSRFTSSSSSVVGQRIRRVDPTLTNNNLVPNNHNNMFAPDRVRVARKVGIGADQQETIAYVQPDELLPGDIAAPANQQNPSGAPPGMRTVSVLGGAVVVGASVALAVSAWNQYSEISKRRKQTDAVRDMPGEYLLLLMDDHRVHRKKGVKAENRLQSGAASATSPVADIITTEAENSTSLVVSTTQGEELVTRTETERDQDDDLVDDFFDCLTEFEEARLQAFAEDEFFDCVEIAEAVANHFATDEPIESEHKEVGDVAIDSVVPTEEEKFPVGCAVSTPFGLGRVEDWRPGCLSALIRFNWRGLGYIQKQNISRGASFAMSESAKAMETKRVALADRIVAKYHLEDSAKEGTIKTLVQAGKDGALDSGIRAAGGVVIAKGMSRSAALSGAVAAPLAIASILVDVGKEYYDYRQKHTERKNLGVLSATSERLMMKDFRLKAGQHLVSGTAAAAGASIGAYSVASTIGFWTGVGITGPIGVVAATSAAIAGGMLGFFAGSKAYTGYTSSYFTSYKTAKEHIDRLELGARILFNEYDPAGSGEISKDDCIKIMTKLYDASGAVSEGGYQNLLVVLQDERFEGPVTWSMFWGWVSTEAAQSLRRLEEEAAAQNEASSETGESWWKNYSSYFNYRNAALPPSAQLAAPDSAMYPSVQTLFKFDVKRSQEDEAAAVQAELVILRAQMEYLVNVGSLTESDAFQLEQLLESHDESLRESARLTITKLHEGHAEAESSASYGAIISSGFTASTDDDSRVKPATDSRTTRGGKKTTESSHTRRLSQDEKQMDALCSLLSTQGLQDFLHAQNIEVPPETAARHDELHCLALLTAAPPATSSL
ncbi:hypothetical protein Poli38472_006113 [Pythium oligandrum]|uniref:J domain-containing protein n=1 Tax=Pythium oligandrum TaxID=41045 RepID=A0A8K1CU00_PYTOL|nr:hypothetical protein Poli38472_006113 [Pythium oligandrum]|eukprot:TMW68645.1 hypothetical protein Poli38472_006113 [Pythium oligandrum]